MPRSFCIPGVFFLLAATVLLVITSISEPFLTATDIVRTHYPDAITSSQNDNLSQVRFGIWGYCFDDQKGQRSCIHQRAYTFQVTSPVNHDTVEVRSSWTRGLAVHPVAAATAFVALLLSLSTHLTITLLASLMSFLAAVITLIAFAIDIALLALVRHEMDNLDDQARTITGPGFWLTFVSLILLLLAGCTVCFGRRRDRAGGATYPTATSSARTPFWRRFGRKNRY